MELWLTFRVTQMTLRASLICGCWVPRASSSHSQIPRLHKATHLTKQIQHDQPVITCCSYIHAKNPHKVCMFEYQKHIHAHMGCEWSHVPCSPKKLLVLFLYNLGNNPSVRIQKHLKIEKVMLCKIKMKYWRLCNISRSEIKLNQIWATDQINTFV